MRKWSDRKKNWTSGHFFLPYVPFLRSEMRKKKFFGTPLFLWPWDCLKIIQNYSWIIHQYSGLFMSFQDFSKIIQDYLAGTTIVCLELKFIHAYSRFFLIIQDYFMVSQNQWLKFVNDYSWVFTIIYDYSKLFMIIQDYPRLWRFRVVPHKGYWYHFSLFINLLKAITVRTKNRLAGRLLRNLLPAYQTGQR